MLIRTLHDDYICWRRLDWTSHDTVLNAIHLGQLCTRIKDTQTGGGHPKCSNLQYETLTQ